MKTGKKKFEKQSQIEISLVAVGDVLLKQEKPELAFTFVSSIFRKADIRFGNLEAPLSDKLNPSNAGITTAFHSDPSAIAGLLAAGFDVLSFANNHSMNHGEEAFMDTLKILSKNKIAYAGGGANITEARRPVILEKKGLKVGFLAYAVSDGLRKYSAYPNKPGIVLIRLSPFFASPFTNQEDVEMMIEDIIELRKKADIVIVSYHWGASQGGNHTITIPQTGLAHIAIDSGADLILGHHPHAVQGIEIYKHKIVAYSLGNFIFDGYKLPMPKETMILNVCFEQNNIKKVSFIPVLIDEIGRPCPLPPDDENCVRIQKMMEKLSGQLGTRLSFKGAEGMVDL